MILAKMRFKAPNRPKFKLWVYMGKVWIYPKGIKKAPHQLRQGAKSKL